MKMKTSILSRLLVVITLLFGFIFPCFSFEKHKEELVQNEKTEQPLLNVKFELASFYNIPKELSNDFIGFISWFYNSKLSLGLGYFLIHTNGVFNYSRNMTTYSIDNTSCQLEYGGWLFKINYSFKPVVESFFFVDFGFGNLNSIYTEKYTLEQNSSFLSSINNVTSEKQNIFMYGFGYNWVIQKYVHFSTGLVGFFPSKRKETNEIILAPNGTATGINKMVSYLPNSSTLSAGITFVY